MGSIKDAVLKWIMEWLASNLTKEMVEKWVNQLKSIVIPYLRARKDDLIKALRDQAAKSDTTIDDAAVDALDWALEALLPDNPKHFQ